MSLRGRLTLDTPGLCKKTCMERQEYRVQKPLALWPRIATPFVSGPQESTCGFFKIFPVAFSCSTPAWASHA